jgi:peptidylprolyl isomerase
MHNGYTKKMDNSQKLEGTKLANFDPQAAVNELQAIDLVEGSGDVVPEGATITAHYTGALVADGTIFQSSHDFGDAITFPLSGVIAGWTQGVPGMKVGGTRRLVIPAEMAYGASSPAPNIPANSDLVFDIELVAIN